MNFQKRKNKNPSLTPFACCVLKLAPCDIAKGTDTSSRLVTTKHCNPRHLLGFQVFNNLIELVTSCGNYSQYRKRFSECLGFRFPILGVHLKDLIAVHVALPDWVDKEKTRVNLTKTQQLYAILQELALIQTTAPNIDANTDLLNLLTVSARAGQKF